MHSKFSNPPIAAFRSSLGTSYGTPGPDKSAVDATLLAVYLHGLAGDLAAERLREGNLAADDLIRILPGAFRMLKGEDEEPSSPRPSSPAPSHPPHREKRERFV